MSSIRSLGRAGCGRAPAAARCLLGMRRVLAGCNTAARGRPPPIPADYRQRHPIVIKEGDAHGRAVHRQQSRRPHAAQRADVLAFAHAWRREATGGIVIDVPAGTRNERAAAMRCSEIRAILAAAGVPPHAVASAALSAGDPRSSPPSAQLSAMIGRRRSVRPVAGGSRPDLRPRAQRKPPVLEPRLRQSAQPRRHGRQSGRSGAAARRNAVLHRAPHDRARQVYRGESTATIYPDANQGKISEVGQ